MQKVFRTLTIISFVLTLSTAAYATNGDNLIAIGPIARAMGGVGIAAPQDAISAVFANPAAMCFGPYCPASEVNFAATAFMPHVDAKISFDRLSIPGGPTFPAQSFEAASHEKIYPIPAIGLSVPITSGPPFWRFGIAAYGVSGLGVDYKNTGIDKNNYFGPGAPLVAGAFTELSIMKFAPVIAFQPFEKLSFGLAVHVDYANLDLREGGSSGFGVGAQVGMIYKVNDDLTLGLNYITPQSVSHDKVTDFDGDGNLDTLKLESPQQVGIGIAYKMLAQKLLIEADVKWINWANANGYESFDWDNQWVFAFGVQYRPISKLALRAGYNFGNNPVNSHNGWDGSANQFGIPNSFTNVQGKRVPTYYYETFRIIGFPAVVEHHATMGVGYDFTPRLAVNLGYMHAFEHTIRETGTNLFGQTTNLESKLSEDSLDFSLTWRF